jgi:hypothetical protein
MTQDDKPVTFFKDTTIETSISTALWGPNPGTCRLCGGLFATSEAKAGFTTCEHCNFSDDANEDNIDPFPTESSRSMDEIRADVLAKLKPFENHTSDEVSVSYCGVCGREYDPEDGCCYEDDEDRNSGR